MIRPDCKNISINCVDAAEWADLRPEWERLHASSEAPTFFLSSTWVDAWLAVFGAELNPAFVCLKDGAQTVGIAMMCRNHQRHGPFKNRQLQLNTAGEGHDSPTLEHNALLCAAQSREIFAATLVETACGMPWDDLVLSGVRRADFDAIEKACPLPTSETWRPAPYVDLELQRSTETPNLASVSRNTRQQIRPSIKLYEARGALELEEATTPDVALEWFEQLISLHEAVWRKREKEGAFASPRQRAFHRQIIAKGVPRGEVQLLRVRAGEETVGVVYNLHHGGHISYYQSGFRYEEDNRIKPGLVCHALAIQRALDNGYLEYDFLAAANDGARYKMSLANASREFGWIRFRRESLKSKALDVLVQAKRKVRSQ